MKKILLGLILGFGATISIAQITENIIIEDVPYETPVLNSLNTSTDLKFKKEIEDTMASTTVSVDTATTIVLQKKQADEVNRRLDRIIFLLQQR